MPESGEQLQNAVRQVEAPDGATFDMIAGRPDDDRKAQLRGNALVDMKLL